MYRTHTTHLSPHLTRSLLKHFSGESYFSIKFSPLELRISKKKKSHGQRSRWPNPIFLVLFKRKNHTTKKKLPIFFVGQPIFFVGPKTVFFKKWFQKKKLPTKANRGQHWLQPSDSKGPLIFVCGCGESSLAKAQNQKHNSVGVC